MNNQKNQRYKYLIFTLVTCLVILIITPIVIKSMTQATFPQITFLETVCKLKKTSLQTSLLPGERLINPDSLVRKGVGGLGF